MQMMFILYYKLLSYYMDTITILGISLLFFYSLTTILQFYGIDTSIYSIYILFYIFIIVSRLILPMNYAKLFPDAEAPLANADDTGSSSPTNNVSGSPTNDVASVPTIVFPPTRSQGEITNIDRASLATSPSPAPDPSTNPPPKNETPDSSGYVDLSGFVQGLASLFSGVA